MKIPQHPMLRFLAQLVAIIFHPLFIPVYLSAFLIFSDPLFFLFNGHEKVLLLVRFVLMYTLFPLFTVLLLKGLGFIQHIRLNSQRDRIIPYVACGVYYFWSWYVLRNQPAIPSSLVLLALGIFLASSLSLIANSYLKVSMHAVAVGVMVAFMLLLGLHASVNYGIYISIAILIAGVVCTSRLITSDHTTAEVYSGLFIGVLCQVVASFFV